MNKIIKLLYVVFIMAIQTEAGVVHFDKSLKESVLSNSKTLTIREGIRDYYELGPYIAKFTDGTQLNIELTKIEFKKYKWSEDNITSVHLGLEDMSDTSHEGFLRLFKGLKKFYPNFNIGDDVTLIYFKLLP